MIVIESYGKFLFLFVVLFLFFCCLGSVFAINDFDSVYIPDEMSVGSVSSSLNVDCNVILKLMMGIMLKTLFKIRYFIK